MGGLDESLPIILSTSPRNFAGKRKRRNSVTIPNMKTHVKKGDEVIVTVGKKAAEGGIKGKRGVVLSVNAAKQTVIVEGVRKIKKAIKPSEANPEGGIQEVDGPIHISNVKKVG